MTSPFMSQVADAIGSMTSETQQDSARLVAQFRPGSVVAKYLDDDKQCIQFWPKVRQRRRRANQDPDSDSGADPSDEENGDSDGDLPSSSSRESSMSETSPSSNSDNSDDSCDNEQEVAFSLILFWCAC